MKTSFLFISLLLILCPCMVFCVNSKPVFDIRDFGAIGDGLTLNTNAIQTAIDSCNASGGGTVYFAPNNIFLTGTVEIKSNVTLLLEGNSRIVGSDYLKDYRDDVGGCPYGEGIDRALIYANGAQNIMLTGTGTIDGGNRGKKNTSNEHAKLLGENGKITHNRPVAIRIRNCKRIRMSDLLFVNSRSWFCHLQFCSDVAIDGITIDNPYQDGFNIESCQDVRISNCSLNCYDDGFALTTSHPDKPIRNVTITNCTVKSHWSAIRFGPLSKGDFENVLFDNMVLYDCEGGGIKIDPCEGGVVQNCMFNNIRMERVRGPICIQSARWPDIGASGWSDKGRKLMPASPIKNLKFSNMIIDAVGRPTNDPNHNPIIWIHGHPEAIVQNISFDNIQMTLPGRGTVEQAERRSLKDVDEIKWDEPGYWYTNKSGFGVPPAYGLYARHASGLQFRNVQLHLEDNDARPALFFYECNNITMCGAQMDISDEASAMAVIKECSQMSFEKIRCQNEVETMFQLENTHPDSMFIRDLNPYSKHSELIVTK